MAGVATSAGAAPNEANHAPVSGSEGEVPAGASPKQAHGVPVSGAGVEAPAGAAPNEANRTPGQEETGRRDDPPQDSDAAWERARADAAAREAALEADLALGPEAWAARWYRPDALDLFEGPEFTARSAYQEWLDRTQGSHKAPGRRARTKGAAEKGSGRTPRK